MHYSIYANTKQCQGSPKYPHRACPHEPPAPHRGFSSLPTLHPEGVPNPASAPRAPTRRTALVDLDRSITTVVVLHQELIRLNQTRPWHGQTGGSCAGSGGALRWFLVVFLPFLGGGGGGISRQTSAYKMISLYSGPRTLYLGSLVILWGLTGSAKDLQLRSQELHSMIHLTQAAFGSVFFQRQNCDAKAIALRCQTSRNTWPSFRLVWFFIT